MPEPTYVQVRDEGTGLEYPVTSEAFAYDQAADKHLTALDKDPVHQSTGALLDRDPNVKPKKSASASSKEK